MPETDGVEFLVSVLDPLSLKTLLYSQFVREARVGIDRLLARYQLLIDYRLEQFKLISEYLI
jgi:hypothetical protein